MLYKNEQKAKKYQKLSIKDVSFYKKKALPLQRLNRNKKIHYTIN
jgi:hypothetical protein